MQSPQGVVIDDWYVGYTRVPDAHGIHPVAFPPGTRIFVASGKTAEPISSHELNDNDLVVSETGEILRTKIRTTYYSLKRYHFKLFDTHKRQIQEGTELYLQSGKHARTNKTRYAIHTNNYLAGLVFNDVYITRHQIYLTNNLKNLSYI